MTKLRRFARNFARLSPLLVVGFCFQNFTELEVPARPEPAAAPARHGTEATSVNGAAEDFVRTQWMPELRNLERRYAEKLQFQLAPGRADVGELEMNLLGDALPARESAETMKVSVVNDRVRLRFTNMDLACDYQPARSLLSLRTQMSTPGQLQFEHSGRDQTSRLSWQMSW